SDVNSRRSIAASIRTSAIFARRSDVSRTAANESKVFAERDTCMRNLFIKIFLWFWLTVAAAGIALALSIVYSNNTPQLKLRLAASEVLPEGAKAAAEEFERSGKTGLGRYLSDIEQR